MYEDKTLVCKECGKEFVFTAGEQEFYAERGFQNEPQRCKACRDARKNAARGPREYFTATCAACGGEAKVPFEPKTEKDTIIGDILDVAPQTAPIFFSIGMHCLGCPSSRGETVEEACAVHGVDVDKLLELVNQEANKAAE